jgi:hypothetical protein
VKGSCYGAVDEVQIMDRLLPFDIDAISRCLRLPQEGMNISSVAQYTDEDLEEVFEPHVRTAFYLRPRVYGGVVTLHQQSNFATPVEGSYFGRGGGSSSHGMEWDALELV